MKVFVLGITILFFSFSLSAQEVELIENPVTFHIKIGTWVEIPKAVKKMIKANELEVITVNQFHTVYTVNAYECYGQASINLKYYIDKGYQDSFVIAFDRGQRISKTEAIEKTKNICK